jgi:predicted nucleic acid-binding protein
MIWVIDASVAIRWLLEDESHPNADAVLTKVVHSPESFVVPELFGFEVFSVIQRLHPDGMNALHPGHHPNSPIRYLKATHDRRTRHCCSALYPIRLDRI